MVLLVRHADHDVCVFAKIQVLSIEHLSLLKMPAWKGDESKKCFRKLCIFMTETCVLSFRSNTKPPRLKKSIKLIRAYASRTKSVVFDDKSVLE